MHQSGEEPMRFPGGFILSTRIIHGKVDVWEAIVNNMAHTLDIRGHGSSERDAILDAKHWFRIHLDAHILSYLDAAESLTLTPGHLSIGRWTCSCS